MPFKNSISPSTDFVSFANSHIHGDIKNLVLHALFRVRIRSDPFRFSLRDPDTELILFDMSHSMSTFQQNLLKNLLNYHLGRFRTRTKRKVGAGSGAGSASNKNQDPHQSDKSDLDPIRKTGYDCRGRYWIYKIQKKFSLNLH
jgi:hypothetical protein